MTPVIRIGPTAGHHFYGQADLAVAKHCERVINGQVERGFFVTRKRLVNRAAYQYDPAMGWEIDRWFEWSAPSEKETV